MSFLALLIQEGFLTEEGFEGSRIAGQGKTKAWMYTHFKVFAPPV